MAPQARVQDGILRPSFFGGDEMINTWHTIDTAPTDGTWILVYAPESHNLPPMISFCAYHESAGFCIDELREPTHWMPLPPTPDA